MIKIGIDQSLSFTGVTVLRDGAVEAIYGITHKKHTKWDKWAEKPDFIYIINYDFEDRVDDPFEDERRKYRNLRRLVDEVDYIISKYNPDEVLMEGVSFGSHQTTAIAELSGLNYLIRDICHKYNIKFTIIPPSKLKKFFTGNGVADKDLMTETFFQLVPLARGCEKYIKIDDIADSYAMACFEER